MKRLAIITLVIHCTWLSHAEAALVPFTPTTTMTPAFPSIYPISGVGDGSWANSNGFVAKDNKGTIQLHVKPETSICGFTLFNDVDVWLDGVRDFRLDFFSGSTPLQNFSATASAGMVLGQTWNFPTVSNVTRVDLVVLDAHTNQVEIRELQLHSCVPEPSSFAMAGLGALGFIYRRRKNAALVA